MKSWEVPGPGAGFRGRRRFEEFARALVRLPAPGEGPLDHLLAEARWQEILAQVPDPEAWLSALSQATGVFFSPPGSLSPGWCGF